MKFLKVAVMAAVALAWSSAYAFHSGGVAECEGCHSMHNSYEGAVMVTGTTLGEGSGPYLLKASDQSGACLNCHEGPTLSGYHVSTSGIAPVTGLPSNMTPGGDFSWLKITTPYTVRGSPSTDLGERRGHNIVAADFGYVADPHFTEAPGGTYPAANLACSSCHDPHGRYRRFADGSIAKTGLPIFNSGSYSTSKDPISGVSAVGVYRILGGEGYQPKSLVGDYAFLNTVPAAVTNSTYNKAETSQQTQVFTAYGQGMSEWCSNCHTGFVSNGYTSGMAGLRHPAGNDAKLPDFIATNYNAYVSSGIMTNTDNTKAYSTVNPFELGTADYTILKTKGGPLGTVDRAAVAGSNNVACVSCHRVHASGFESMLRFFYLNEFMTVADASNVAQYDGTDGLNGSEGKIHHGFSKAQVQRAYYERPATEFGPWARMRCNKCHAKD
jgi:mono/diheme cytochrome c family protein